MKRNLRVERTLRLTFPEGSSSAVRDSACWAVPPARRRADISRFLFGNAVLLYKDIGSDSVNSYYPDFVHLSNYIRSQGFPSWSFYVGMGQDLAYATGYLIWQPVSWLPSDLIAPALVFQHLGKVLIAGLFFFRFLQLRRLQFAGPAPGFAPAFFLGLHVHGQLLVSFRRRSCLFRRDIVSDGGGRAKGPLAHSRFSGRAGRNDNAIPSVSLRLVSRRSTSRQALRQMDGSRGSSCAPVLGSPLSPLSASASARSSLCLISMLS